MERGKIIRRYMGNPRDPQRESIGGCPCKERADIRGQLSDLPGKSIEPMADAARIPARNLQKFLDLYRWDESHLRNGLQQDVVNYHGHPHLIEW
jgi:hypothetical protein